MSEFDDEVLPEDGVEEEEEILSEDDEPETDPLDGIEIANDANLPDPATVITIRTSGGDTRYVPASEGLTVGEAILQSGVSLNGSWQVWMNGAEMHTGDVVPAGTTLTVLTTVKGGA